MEIQIQNRPNKEELEEFFETAFSCIIESDRAQFSEEQNQTLSQWFDVAALIDYLPYGELWEARDDTGQLIGAAFEGKQQPMSWPDGKKAELFILAVDPNHRGKGLGKELVRRCEQSARVMGARKLLVNTNTLMAITTAFYQDLGYQELGVLRGYYDNGDAIFLGKDLK